MTTSLVDAFVVAAAEWGECHDSHRFEQADLALPAVKRAEDELRLSDREVENTFKALAAAHSNPWVRYCAATALARTEPEAALTVLEELASEDGLWAATSQLAVFYLKAQRH